ncbi:hypothetical protein ACWGR4_03425 [Embleya sp. NPDC055664]|uniref:hypothetical protein n=1 Tax=Embleya sp. NPDC059237 TaxID=3346784 RepID=UPI00369DDA94
MSDIAGRLDRLLASLTHSRGVFASSGAFARPGPDMPEFVDEIRAFLERVVDVEAVDLFAYYTQGRPVLSMGHLQMIDRSIFPLETPEEAVELLTEAASVSLAWSPKTIMNPDIARETATEIVATLGPEAIWWSNREQTWRNGLTPITFDLLVAGMNGTHFALLLQVEDD